MEVLIIINSLFTFTCIGVLFYRYFPFYLCWGKTERLKRKCSLILMRVTSGNRRTGSYGASSVFRISFRDIEKENDIEDAMNLLGKSEQAQRQVLRAKFSWLRTIEEVEQFEKIFSVVNEDCVSKLVAEFKAKMEDDNTSSA